MFDNLDSLQKALLARALNTELNTITKLYKRSSSHMALDFKEQHRVVFEMWNSIYPAHPDDNAESDLENRLSMQ